MTCRESRLLEFLAGDLSAEEAQSFDDHLLTCESCWHAVQEDRAGRLAAERLRESAPRELADRVVLAVELAAHDRAAGAGARPRMAGAKRRPRRDQFLGHGAGRARRLVIGAAVSVALLAGGLALALAGGSAPKDPAQVAAVMALARPPHTPSGVAPGAAAGGSLSHQLVVDGQHLAVTSYRVEGILTVVATSSHPFPMPPAAHVMTGSSPAAWMATRGKLALYCVNRQSGHESMLVVAAMPAAQLPAIAARLHLI